MKVINLQCSQQHFFEGWFASEDDFQLQKSRNWVQCPMCGDSAVLKMPSAPRLNLRAAKKPDASRTVEAEAIASEKSIHSPRPATSKPNADTDSSHAAPINQNSYGEAKHESHDGNMGSGLAIEHQAAFAKAVREMVQNSTDVGERFAEEARQMHYGEKQARSIRGQASRSETIALLEEGIDILPLPSWPGLKETLQ